MSTRTALTVVGGIVGAYFGYPQLGLVVGSLVGNAVDPQHVAGPQIGEIPAQTSADGVNRPLIWGTTWVYGNIIQQGPVIKVEDDSDQGKGGPEQGEGDKVYRTFAVRIAGPIGGILRVWADNKLVYDVRPGSQMLEESAKWMQNKVLYLGDEDQLPDPNLVALDPDNTHAYRGTSYMVFVLEDLTARGGSYSQYRWEVASVATLEEVYEPLVINPWRIGPDGRPIHGEAGLMEFTSIITSSDWTDYVTAVNANAAEYGTVYAIDPVRKTAEFSKTYIGYKSSTNSIINTLPGGASLVDDPQALTYRLSKVSPSSYNPRTENCLDFAIFFDEQPRYTEWVNGYEPVVLQAHSDPSLVLEGYYLGVTCGSEHGYMNYVGELGAMREPSPRDGLIDAEIISGEAKQLSTVEYRDGVLYQNALGPILFPGDPNYDNSTYWEEQKDIAIANGTLHADVAMSPVIVDSYVHAYTQVTGYPVTLGSIVADVHRRCGIDASMYDVSELTNLVDGFSASGDYTGADIITELRKTYFFDKSEHDKKLWYPLRGLPVIETLTIEDMTEIPDISKREQAGEVPKKLNLKYQHAASGYVPVKSTFSSSSTDIVSSGETTIESAVVMDENQAAQTVQKMWKVARTDIAGELVISTPLNVGMKYVPGNCIGVSLRGITTRERIDRMDYDAGVIKLTLRSDRQSAYTSTLTGVPIPPPTLPPSTIVGLTEMAILDIPARTESEDDLNYLVAVTGPLPPWYGARYRRSFDGGSNFTNVQDITTASIMGVITNEVADASEYFTDTTNTINVNLYRPGQTIESISETQFLSEGGAFALQKDDGSWEICQYRDANEESDGSFTLSTLHRGQLNSGTSSHSVGARLVMLTRPTHIPAQSSWIGAFITHQAVSLGDSVDNTTNTFTQTYVGRSQIEWPVTSLELTRNVNDISATWVPRHRFGTANNPIASVNFQGYRVTIDDGSISDTFDTTNQFFTNYDASGMSSPVTVTVSSLNRITGAGPATSDTI